MGTKARFHLKICHVPLSRSIRQIASAAGDNLRMRQAEANAGDLVNLPFSPGADCR
jgi:hypothetical protein